MNANYDAGETSIIILEDLDNDGDLDIISGSKTGKKIGWQENIDGAGHYGNLNLITSNVDHVTDLMIIDIDGDGYKDLISGSSEDGKIAWYKNDGFGNFSKQKIIIEYLTNVHSVFGGDIDGDGDTDIIASVGCCTITWFENTDGLGTFSEHTYNTPMAVRRELIVTNINNNDSPDIILTGSELFWYEYSQASQELELVQEIEESPIIGDARYVKAGDIDSDGDTDLIVSDYNNNALIQFNNTNGEGLFDIEYITTDFYESKGVDLFDMDGDNDLDVIASSNKSDLIVSFENLGGISNFQIKENIAHNADFVVEALPADVDSDGDVDIISSSKGDGKISWYENLDGFGTYGEPKIISLVNNNGYSITSSDINMDGNIDIVASIFEDGKVFWFENDGQGIFNANLIALNVSNAGAVFSEDLDEDGDIDVIISSTSNIYWFENLDGSGNFGGSQLISTTPNGPFYINLADINNDSHIDIVSAIYNENKLVWYENINGEGVFSSEKIISSSVNSPLEINTVDIDGDEDVDVFFTSLVNNTVSWFENLTGKGTFGPEQIISTTNILGIDMFFSDLDGDNDFDLIAADQSNDKFIWYENLDGVGSFGSENIIKMNADAAQSVHAIDVDQDGDHDIIAASYLDNTISWFENLRILGLNETLTLDFSIHPNPSSNYLNITLQKEIAQIAVYNNVGQLVMEPNNFINDNPTINTSTLPTGIYFIKIKTEGGSVGIRKFLKI